MPYTNYSIFPINQSVKIDGQTAFGVDMTGIPLDVSVIQWYGLRDSGEIQYKINPVTGIMPDPAPFTDPDDYSAQINDAEAILAAQNDPHIYYFTEQTSFEGNTYAVADAYVSLSVGWPAPPNTTPLVPPSPANGQSLYWYDGAWVLSSFNPNLTLSAAKSSLIQTVNQDGASAVNSQLSIYSTAEQITAPDVLALSCANYPTTSVGDYQTYVNGLISDATATINLATTTEDLYSFNPAEIPFTSESSGVIFTGRGSGLGPLDMNVSYFTTWNSTTVDESDTELYAPATSMVMAYGSGGAGKFDSAGNAFTSGNYTVQLRQASTGFVLAEWECPLAPAGVDVPF